MTIYRMYVDQGNRAGFWVQHRSWPNACARVDSIGGLESGRLPGRAPNHDDAEVRIRGFDVRSGRPVDLGAIIQTPCDQHFAVIAEPMWFRNHRFTKPPVLAALAPPVA